MIDRLDELVKILSDLMSERIQRKDFESFLEIAIASRMLFRALPGGEGQSGSALSNIEYALSLVTGKEEPVDLPDIKQACSFCDKQAPVVMLGAGHSAFICNECVELFTEIFQKEKDETPKGQSPKA